MNSQASTSDQILEVVALANHAGLYDAADWFLKWQQANHRNQRYASLAGDFWNLAHEAVSALGAWNEAAQDWRFDQIEDDDNRILAIRLSQLIEDYDKLTAEQAAGDPPGKVAVSDETPDYPPPVQSEVPFCTCGHSLYDHAVETAVDPLKHDLHGECFVGGCGCGRWKRDHA